MESNASNGHGVARGLFIGLLAGGALGASLALLYAPKPGRRLRAELKDKAGDLLDQGKDYLSTVQQRTSEIVGDARRGFSELFTSTEKEVARSVKSAGSTSKTASKERKE
jgi:gas vesicle protein